MIKNFVELKNSFQNIIFYDKKYFFENKNPLILINNIV